MGTAAEIYGALRDSMEGRNQPPDLDRGPALKGAGGVPGGGGAPPPGGAPPNRGSKGGPRAGKPFTPEGKKEVRDTNRARNGGKLTCDKCGRNDLVDPQKAKGGEPLPENQGYVDHIIPEAEGGDGAPSNGQVLCWDCHLDKTVEEKAARQVPTSEDLE